jgi:hypothetical protein
MSVRLACVKHAASVHPEPGSNSPCIYFCLIQALAQKLTGSLPVTLQLLKCRLHGENCASPEASIAGDRNADLRRRQTDSNLVT